MLTEFNRPASVTEMLSAYFVSGMYINDSDRPAPIAALDDDISVIADVCSYAEPLANMMTAAVLCVGDTVKGVFLYEVAERFGNWFAEAYLVDYHLPQRAAVLAKLRELVMDFYSQAEDCDRERLASAVRGNYALGIVH